ncbi:squalene/phytoene synthase family protein [Jannaschia sp. LMIT008]|uniref:squalene/phytoene synthase family protein n=1 Tax=Jannaschia maritima TaxID=3032585 RepID=UPI002811AB95|nr:squalene/phytoene synthase family protein [Jannaschia sp. LMIT008]
MADPSDDDVGACAALVARGDPPRFRAAMAAPLDVRRVLFPIYAFNLEVARAPWVVSDPMLARIRLQWWRDVLAEIAEGRPVRRHEVATPLGAVLDADAARALDDLVVVRHDDLERAAPADADAVVAYADATAGALLRMAGRLAGGTGDDALGLAGRAQGLAGYLSAVPILRDRGFDPLPPGDMDLTTKALAEQGLDAARRARSLDADARSRAVMLVLPEAAATLRALSKHPAAPVPSEPPLRARLSLAWRAASGRP